ncbi:MAG: YlbF family regulator [Anaerolineaceae bacterium]
MPLTDEIKQAAAELGAQLGTEPDVCAYVQLRDKTRQDDQTVALEQQYEQVYQQLLERQLKGEVLEQSDLAEYYQLQFKVQNHPLIRARDGQLTAVQALFYQTAQRLSNTLGADYTVLSK